MRTVRIQTGSISTPAVISLALAALLVLVAVWLSNGLLASDRWPIQWLQVDGQFQRISPEQVRSQVVSEAGTGFFAVDLRAVKASAEALPWVATAEVRKQWPDTIHVRVLEHRPVARWGTSAMVSDRGHRFEVPGAGRLQGLPMLQAPDSQFALAIEQWQAFREQLQKIGADVDTLNLSERGAWDLRLNNGIHVRLGRDQVESRLARLVAAFPKLQAEAGERLPETIDLRYSNGFAVQWSEPTTPERRGNELPPPEPGQPDSGDTQDNELITHLGRLPQGTFVSGSEWLARNTGYNG